MGIKLSDHFGYRRILRFTMPSIASMLFTSIYGIVDGYFVSNFAGKAAFTAVNFIMPVVMILGTFGFMLGTGGSALIGKLLGQKQNRKATEVFSMLVVVAVVSGIVLAIAGNLLARPFASLMGARDEMLDLSVLYGRIVLAGLPLFMLQIEFNSFFILAEKPKLGLLVTVLSGCANMALDALLVGALRQGIAGAATATVGSQILASGIAIVFFTRPNGTPLRLGRFRLRLRDLWLVCTNGSSEMMSSVAMSVVGMLYNIQLLRHAGEDGVAAYGVLMYVSFIFVACFIGYSMGIAPVVSYHFGAGNHAELKSLLRKSLSLIGIVSLAMFAGGELLGRPFSTLFAGYDAGLAALTAHAFAICSLSFLFCGVPIFGSSFFTALNDGLTSALISFLRTLVFELLAILVMPRLWGAEGIWWSVVTAEVAAVALTTAFLWGKRGKYHYA